MTKEERKVRRLRLFQAKLCRILVGMIKRCYDEDNRMYAYYGGRGITIFQEWLEMPSKFVSWALEKGYKEGLEIDRINNDGNYEPSNCRWVTHLTNMNNTRQNRNITAFGETKSLSSWARDPRCKVSKQSLQYRLDLQNLDPEEAISRDPTSLGR